MHAQQVTPSGPSPRHLPRRCRQHAAWRTVSICSLMLKPGEHGGSRVPAFAQGIHTSTQQLYQQLTDAISKFSLTAFMRLCCAGLHHLQLPQPLRRPPFQSPLRPPGTQLLHSRLPSLPTMHRQRVRRWGFWHWSCRTGCSSAFQRPSLAQCT